jgi:hypothetical protein
MQRRGRARFRTIRAIDFQANFTVTRPCIIDRQCSQAEGAGLIWAVALDLRSPAATGAGEDNGTGNI